MSIYADSSFFVALYLHDRRFRQAERLLAQHTRVWLTPLHRAEWTHALAQQCLLRNISAVQSDAVRRDFERDRQSRFWIEVNLPDTVFDRCIELVQQHGRRIAMGTLGTLHVASAMELGAERFWTFDDRQAKLARAAGLKV